MATIIGIITVVSAVVGLAVADDKRASKAQSKKSCPVFCFSRPDIRFLNQSRQSKREQKYEGREQDRHKTEVGPRSLQGLQESQHVYACRCRGSMRKS